MPNEEMNPKEASTEYDKWAHRVNQVSKIVEMTWDKYLPLFNYNKNINVCEMKKEDYDFICMKIDELVESYFVGAYGLYIRNGFLPGWNYQARHKRRKSNEPRER